MKMLACILNFKIDRESSILHSKMFYTLICKSIYLFFFFFFSFKCIVYVCAHMIVCTYVYICLPKGRKVE